MTSVILLLKILGAGILLFTIPEKLCGSFGCRHDPSNSPKMINHFKPTTAIEEENLCLANYESSLPAVRKTNVAITIKQELSQEKDIILSPVAFVFGLLVVVSLLVYKCTQNRALEERIHQLNIQLNASQLANHQNLDDRTKNLTDSNTDSTIVEELRDFMETCKILINQEFAALAKERASVKNEKEDVIRMYREYGKAQAVNHREWLAKMEEHIYDWDSVGTVSPSPHVNFSTMNWSLFENSHP